VPVSNIKDIHDFAGKADHILPDYEKNQLINESFLTPEELAVLFLVTCDSFDDLCDRAIRQELVNLHHTYMLEANPALLIGAVGQRGSQRRSGSRSCQDNSFIGESRVLMADGSTKPIEDIEVGDQVQATDPITEETGPRTVVATITGEGVKSLVDITIDTDGKAGNATGAITATTGHPIWLDDQRRWNNAGDIEVGDSLRDVHGGQVDVLVNRRPYSRNATVHNLTVDGIHTYYVLAGEAPVLVHNTGCTLFSKAGIQTTPHFDQRLVQRASRNITPEKALDAYRNGRVFFDPRSENYIRYSSRTRTAVVVSRPSGGTAITVFEGNVSPAWQAVRWRPG
jgi:hypothetical protein